MKITTILTLVTSLALSSQSYASLVAYYNLNEASGSVTDLTGNTGPGDSAGTPSYAKSTVTAATYGAITVDASTASAFGTSVDFADPGIGNFKLSNDSPITGLIAGGGTGSLTVSAWILADSLAQSSQIIASTGSANNGWKFALRDSGSLQFVANNVSAAAASTLTIAAGGWHYVSVTYSDKSVAYFIDGIAAGTSSVTGFTDESGETKIGGRSGGSENFFGRIDEVKYYDSVLTASEIQGEAIITVVPEPSSAALLGLGGLALILRRRK